MKKGKLQDILVRIDDIILLHFSFLFSISYVWQLLKVLYLEQYVCK